MHKTIDPTEPRTTTDIVFDSLFNAVQNLELLPGSRISEAEVANRMGVSRQPVRDAFNRLGNLGLLTIRPQRATEVRGFSMPEIENARFVRLAVELEVVERACRVWDDACQDALQANLDRQVETVESGRPDALHALDYEYHRLICDLGGNALAFNTIEQCKSVVDRLCKLSFGRENEATAVLQDHHAIAAALQAGSVKKARSAVKRHLSRLDDTIREIHETHSDYFE